MHGLIEDAEQSVDGPEGDRPEKQRVTVYGVRTDNP